MGGALICLAAGCFGLSVAANALLAGSKFALETREGVYPVRFELHTTPTRAAPMLLPNPTAAAATAIGPVEPAKDGELPTVESPKARVAAPKPDIMSGLIPIKFRLGGSASVAGKTPGDQIALSLPLVYNDAAIGSVAIWIDPAGAITIDSGELSRVVSSKNKDLSEALVESRQDRTSFASLRARGVTINYDPLANRLIMKDRS